MEKILLLHVSIFFSLFILFTSPLSLPLIVPEPTSNSLVLALNYLSPPYYAGLRRDLQCSVDSLYIHNDPTVTVTIDILFNGTIVPPGFSSGGRKILLGVSSNPGAGQYRQTLRFQFFVSSEDSGLYTCMVNVSSNYLSSYIVNASISRTNEYNIVGKYTRMLLNYYCMYCTCTISMNRLLRTCTCCSILLLITDVSVHIFYLLYMYMCIYFILHNTCNL